MEDAKQFGIDPELILARIQQPEELEIWPDNLDTLNLFLRLETQWQRTGMGTVTGLNYQSLEAVAKLTHGGLTLQLLDDIRAMELAAIPILNGANES